MQYRDIVVYLDASDLNEARLETAIAVAERHAARLIGIDISTTAALEGERRERARTIQDAFEERLAQTQLERECRSAGPSASTAQELFAHCADLIVSSQPHIDSAHLAAPAVPKDVLLNSGVPMLVLPTEWRTGQQIGRSILVAWNFSRESTRALHDSMPMLAKAEHVSLFIFEPGFNSEDSEIQDVVAHLGRHGIEATLDGWRHTGKVDVMDAMFASLDRQQSDLIVAGAYGKSPLWERLFGGASEQLLANVSMPLLMSH